MRSRFVPASRFLSIGVLLCLVILSGCTTPPEPEPDPGPGAPFSQELLRADETGYTEGRTGFFFPHVLPGAGLTLAQAWEYHNRIVGIEYRPGGSASEVALTPIIIPESIRNSGTVTVNTYPAGYEAAVVPESIAFSSVLELTGLGHGINSAEEEFWAYQGALEAHKYNLWKLAKLVDTSDPDNVFQSLLVLKKLSEQRSDAIVLTLGRVGDTYILITTRKYVRSRPELDAFGDWAYDVLKDLGLSAM